MEYRAKVKYGLSFSVIFGIKYSGIFLNPFEIPNTILPANESEDLGRSLNNRRT